MNRNFVERQIEWYKKQIEHDTEDISFINYELKKSRDEDTKIKEHVWSKGVITELDMKIFGSEYVGSRTKKLLEERTRAYRIRKNNGNWLRKYKEYLEQYV